MKAFTKNLLRSITKSKNRYFSLLAICAIGVGFFSGVRATSGDMRVSADKFYDKSNLFDLRVLSTFGLTEDDAAEIEKIDGVSGVYTSKYTDLAMHYENNEFLTRVYSWNNDEVNKIELVEGRIPQAENECIISINQLKAEIQLGDTVSLEDLTQAEDFPLKYDEYTVVGIYQTPMFISITQRGSTSIGDGSLAAFMYITESNFTQEIYTEIYVTSDQLTNMESYSAEYEQLRDSISDSLETLGVERSVIRYNEVLGEAKTEIADAEAELAQAKIDGQKELDDAKAELEDAAQKIADGEKELADAKITLDDGEKQLEEGRTTLDEAKTEIEKGLSELRDSKITLDDAAQQLSEAKAELDKNEQLLSQTRSQLESSEKELLAAQTEIDSRMAELESGKAQLEESKAQLALSEEQYNAGLEQYEQGLAQYNEGEQQLLQLELQIQQLSAAYGETEQVLQLRAQYSAQSEILSQTKIQLDQTNAQLSAAKAQIDDGREQITQSEQTISQGEMQLAVAREQLEDGRAQYIDGLSQYEEGFSQFNEGKAKYLESLTEYTDGLEKYNDGLAQIQQAQQDYDEGEAEFLEKQAEYEDGLSEYNDGIAELEDARKQYEDGLVEYSEGEETFRTEIEDAQKKLDDAKKEISDAGEAKWYVFTRDDNAGYSEYSSNADRINQIAAIFPVFFLLVAALVCLTTMSRMVEEERGQIGTLKALGYTNGRIMGSYMIYAVSAAAVGSVIGAFGGMVLFPYIIILAYSMMYNITDITFLYDPGNFILSAGSMVAAIALTVLFSCLRTMKETPAGLMRPKAPKAGKRVVLEKISFIWNNLSFFGKVSNRNLFRYKRRMFMTVVGIAGCTALSLTGFGLKDSISDIVSLQYNEVYNYSGYIAIEDDLLPDERRKLYDSLLEYDGETAYTDVLMKQYQANGEKSSVNCYVTVAGDGEIFEQMISLHERVSGEKLSLSDGIIATEKLAKLLGAGVGDEINIKISDSNLKTVKIAGITEHYAGHFLYMTEQTYSEVFGEAPSYNLVYFINNLTNTDESQRNAFSERMMSEDGVLSVSIKFSESSSFKEKIQMLDLVIIVLIISAGALAFVVMYNLTSVNIRERIREIATLKVLGFYDREVSSYVFRENIILTIMGDVVGMGLGAALCSFVVQTAEIDEVMFGREIHPLSFVLAFAITIIFSLVVNIVMTRVLNKVSMVESLKSVE